MKKTHGTLIVAALLGAMILSISYAQEYKGLEWDGYRKWHHVTAARPNTGDPTGFLDKKHKGTKAYREIYINNTGAPTNKGEAPYPYPEGTVIVKESYKNQAAWEQKNNPELTIMIKLAPGMAPSTGDWEFVMGGNGKKRGRGVKSKWGKFCSDCHINAIATDYAFINAEFLRKEKE